MYAEAVPKSANARADFGTTSAYMMYAEAVPKSANARFRRAKIS
jgi:hypothetical protein